MDEIIVCVVEEAYGRVIEVCRQGPPGPPGDGGSVPRIELGAAGETVLIWDVPVDMVITCVEVCVTRVYNDPLAAVTVGTDADPAWLPVIAKLQGTGVYQNFMNVPVTAPTSVKAFLNSVATVGGCSVTLKFIPKGV